MLHECLLDPILKFIDGESKRRLGHAKVTSDEVNEVFQVVIQIKEFTSQLLRALEDASQNGEALGPVFVRYAPFFRLYSTYYEHFSKAQDQLAALREKKWLDTFISKCETEPRCGGLMLRDYLIEPVQRVPRYEMLLKEMAKYTSMEDPERPGLMDAVSKVQEVAHDMNKTITEKEMREKVSELSKRWGANFAAPSRIFVREGFLSSENSRGKLTTYCFLLFNDLFVYGRERTSLEMSTSMGMSSKRFKLKYQGE